MSGKTVRGVKVDNPPHKGGPKSGVGSTRRANSDARSHASMANTVPPFDDARHARLEKQQKAPKK